MKHFIERRKNMKEEFHSITARLPKSDFEEIERIAAKRGLSLNQVVKMLVGVGVECHKDMESVGLIGVVDFLYYVKQSMKKSKAGKQLILPI
jgi:hypothetical protein